MITVQSVEKIIPPKPSGPSLIVGNHLKPLATALSTHVHLQFIGDSTYSDVPAAFDIGHQGKLAALRSLLDLRQQLAGQPSGTHLVFDRLRWRERIIAGRTRHIGLPDANNIYAAHEKLFHSLGYAMRTPTTRITPVINSAVIIPVSRIIRKTIPVDVIAGLHARLKESGITTSVLSFQGENTAVPPGVPMTVVPRTFPALISALCHADMVISPDSLAAHLSERYGRPTFVVTPIANQYWLPHQAFVNDSWACFNDLTPFSKWLQRAQP